MNKKRVSLLPNLLKG